MRRASGGTLLLASCLLLAACASEKPKPTPLETIQPQLEGRTVWNARFDRVTFPLAVQARDGAFVVAGGDGSVAAGCRRAGWRTNAGACWRGQHGRFTAVAATARSWYSRRQRAWRSASAHASPVRLW
jgi:hypothetical protein